MREPTKRVAEKPKQTAFRLYGRDRVMLRKIARKGKLSASQVVRNAITLLHSVHFPRTKQPEE